MCRRFTGDEAVANNDRAEGLPKDGIIDTQANVHVLEHMQKTMHGEKAH